jgi:hypothetical protein
MLVLLKYFTIMPNFPGFIKPCQAENYKKAPLCHKKKQKSGGPYSPRYPKEEVLLLSIAALQRECRRLSRIL